MKKSALWIAIDNILWEEWDPIGINSDAGAVGEYRGYIPSILTLLSENADAYKMQRLLHQHANVNMGLSTSLEAHKAIAQKIIALNGEH